MADELMLSLLSHILQECSHYYYPTGVYTPHLSPPPEETRGLGKTQTWLRAVRPVNTSQPKYHATFRVYIWPCSNAAHLQYFPIVFSPCVLCALQDVIRRPVDHLYEDVRDVGMYQDTAAPSRPAPSVVFEHKLSQQRNEWRLPTRPRVCK